VCLCAALIGVLLPNVVLACHVDDSAFKAVWRNDLNKDINDYGRILADADSTDSWCNYRAATELTNKVTATPATTWGQWLQPGVAAYAFAAGLRIGAHGYLTTSLDNALRAITPNLATGRKLSAVWGVHCVVAEDAKDLDDMVSRAGSIAFRDGFARAGQRVIIVAGVPLRAPGTTNMVRIASVGPDGDAET